MLHGGAKGYAINYPFKYAVPLDLDDNNNGGNIRYANWELPHLTQRITALQKNMVHKINEAKVGMPAPDFSLDDQKLQPWQLSANRGKVVALIFYPKDETMVCTRQFCSLLNRWTDYLDTGATVLGISPDTSGSHVKFATRHKLPLPLLSDPGRRVARQYISHWLYPVSFTRGLVVIDAEGIVRYREIMLRLFRPLDNDVIKAIRRAKFASPSIEIPSLSDGTA